MRTLERITIISPGEMGVALGRKLIESGFDVRSFVRDRGEETQLSANAAGFVLCETFDDAVHGCDMFVSLVPPEQAIGVAHSFAELVGKSAHEPPVYLDCNSVSPASAEIIGDVAGSVGAVCADGAFLGTANMLDSRTVLLVSGPASETIAQHFGGVIKVRLHGDHIGTASALKMCFGSFNKGLVALYLSVISSAARINAASDLIQYLAVFYPETCGTVLRLLPSYPKHVARRRQEVRELHSWLESINHFTGFAFATDDVFRMLDEIPFEPAAIDFESVIQAFLEHTSSPQKDHSE